MSTTMQDVDAKNTTDRHVLAVMAAAGAGDGLVMFGGALGLLPLWLALLLHGGVVAAALIWLWRCKTVDWALASIGLLAAAVAGPLGAVCAVALTVFERHSALSHDVMTDWYRRMTGDSEPDAASLIFEGIRAGRSVQTGAGGHRSFYKVMDSGSLLEKQALLGLIGLRYDKVYFPILALALRSPEASVRAQAAAVFVNLKDRYKTRLRACLAASEMEGLERARSILECTGSGFIDALEARSAVVVARSLCEEAMAAGPADRAELLACRVLTACGDHDRIAGWLVPRKTNLTAELRTILAHSLMVLGRHRELAGLLQLDALGSSR